MFDTVHHQTLLHRLHNRFGIQGVACQQFTPQQAERKQFVSMNNSELSTSRLLTRDVSQGSLPGPLLYTM